MKLSIQCILLLALCAPAGGADTWPIEGRVVDGFGEPVDGAAIRVYLTNGYRGDFDDLPSPLLEVATDAEGQYRGTFTFTGSGGQRSYLVIATKAGYYPSEDRHLSFGEEESDYHRTAGHVVLQGRVAPSEWSTLMSMEDDAFSNAAERLLRRGRTSLIRSMLEENLAHDDAVNPVELGERLLPVLERLAAGEDEELSRAARDVLWFVGDGSHMKAVADIHGGRGYFVVLPGARTLEGALAYLEERSNVGIVRDPRVLLSAERVLYSPLGNKAFLRVKVTKVGAIAPRDPSEDRPLLVAALREGELWRVLWTEPGLRGRPVVAPWEAVFPELIEALVTGAR